MNILLWVLQGYTAILFGYSGIMKSTQNRERLVRIGQTGVDGLPYSLIRTIGFTEILGAVGIIFPWATGIAPWLTPLTSACFAFIMMLAAPIHYRRHELKAVVGVNLTTFIICVVIAYFRFKQL
jgi:hypothetical protein